MRKQILRAAICIAITVCLAASAIGCSLVKNLEVLQSFDTSERGIKAIYNDTSDSYFIIERSGGSNKILHGDLESSEIIYSNERHISITYLRSNDKYLVWLEQDIYGILTLNAMSIETREIKNVIIEDNDKSALYSFRLYGNKIYYIVSERTPHLCHVMEYDLDTDIEKVFYDLTPYGESSSPCNINICDGKMIAAIDGLKSKIIFIDMETASLDEERVLPDYIHYIGDLAVQGDNIVMFYSSHYWNYRHGVSSYNLGILRQVGDIKIINKKVSIARFIVTESLIYGYSSNGEGLIFDTEKGLSSTIKDCFFIGPYNGELHALTYTDNQKTINFSKIVF